MIVADKAAHGAARVVSPAAMWHGGNCGASITTPRRVRTLGVEHSAVRSNASNNSNSRTVKVSNKDASDRLYSWIAAILVGGSLAWGVAAMGDETGTQAQQAVPQSSTMTYVSSSR